MLGGGCSRFCSRAARLPREPRLLQGVPTTSPPGLLAVVGSLGELAGGVTKDRTTDRQAAGEGIVADKPWRIDVRIGLDRKVLNFCDGIHGECAAGLRRRAGGVLALIVHDIKLAGNPLANGH